jgi:RNA-directed DNA polymerase
MKRAKPSAAATQTFCAMSAITDVANFLGTTERRLFYYLYSRSKPTYRRFEIPKAAGGHRVISAPPKVIAAWQTTLLPHLEAAFGHRRYVHGFTRDRSVKTNAQPHVRARVVLNFDLADFFPTIHFGRVRGMFQGHPFRFSPTVASVLAQICCFDGALPQGAPTSPIISNFICRGLDKELAQFARTHGCRYSRYCDDITLSTGRDNISPAVVEFTGGAATPPILGTSLVNIVTSHSFAVNERKTRVQTFRQRQEVTGLVVNDRVNVPRRFVRNIRSILHACDIKGVKAAEEEFHALRDRRFRIGAAPNLSLHVFGKLAYLRMVRGATNGIYQALAIRAHHHFTNGTGRPLIISGSAALPPKLLRHAVWVIIGRDAKGDILSEGTAFTLAGTGIVTALHVFTNEPCVSYEIRPAYNPNACYKISAYRAATAHDLAIVETDAPIFTALKRASEMPVLGSSVTLAGYPAWISPADDLLVCPANVIHTKIGGDTTYMLISADIRGGNSGGPLLAADGQVVGVAVYDSDAAVAPNGCAAIGHIDVAAGQPAEVPFG